MPSWCLARTRYRPSSLRKQSSRRLFELDLQRHGITGDIRDQLIAQYEAAATLEGQIVAAQPAFQALNTIIDSISNVMGRLDRTRL